ncbi:MAG: amidase [Rhodococcus sp.]|nr:amidase [Rhodococcus sp. (in: high G+C Gram-positive bacteria)]MBJ7325358.1 amidase [Rhodococcus sp. (in: high G+C Gram-positive bacteria)]
MAAKFSRRSLFGGAAAGGIRLAIGTGNRASAQVLPAPDSIDATDPALLGAVEAASLLQAGELSPRELLDACFARSRAMDGPVNAWIRIYPEVAYAAADAAATRLSAAGRTREVGGVPLVCGLPIGLKDLYAVSGLPLTASSRVLERNIAAGDSGVWRRLRDAGMVLMGHTHTHEFAIGVATSQVGNPWDLSKSAGGSSGGSAAALAASFTPLAAGTDTGGSLRIPASACGIAAIKPTFGRCSTAGVIPLAWSRDHTGPMARNVSDAALLLSYMAGADVEDPTTSAAPDVPQGGYPISAVGGSAPLSGRRIGLPVNAVGDLPSALATLFDEALNQARRLRAEIVEVELPAVPDSLLLGDLVEVGSYHQQFADRIGLYQPDNALLMGRNMVALASPVSDYLGFERDRLRFQRDYNRMFMDFGLDAIAMPGATVDGVTRNQLSGFSVFDGVMANVVWANYAGVPALCLPVGRSQATGMPFGIQLGGLAWQENTIIEIALELEAAAPHWRHSPQWPTTPREIPEVALTQPGLGPEATNTRSDPPALYALPTQSTRA